MLVKDVMSPTVVCCHLHASLRDVAQAMRDHDCGCLPVSRNASEPHDLVGLVTDRDLVCRAVTNGMDPLGTTVSAVMTAPVETIPDDAHLADCIDLMAQKKVRRLVVVDGQGHCCGIISTGDIARVAPTPETGSLLQEVCEPGTGPHALVLQSGMTPGNKRIW